MVKSRKRMQINSANETKLKSDNNEDSNLIDDATSTKHNSNEDIFKGAQINNKKEKLKPVKQSVNFSGKVKQKLREIKPSQDLNMSVNESHDNNSSLIIIDNEKKNENSNEVLLENNITETATRPKIEILAYQIKLRRSSIRQLFFLIFFRFALIDWMFGLPERNPNILAFNRYFYKFKKRDSDDDINNIFHLTVECFDLYLKATHCETEEMFLVFGCCLFTIANFLNNDASITLPDLANDIFRNQYNW